MCSAIRSNIGLAQTMNIKEGHDLASELSLTPKQVSTGLALFYVCYVLFDLPSNLVMSRVSPHAWMSQSSQGRAIAKYIPVSSVCSLVSSLRACGPACRTT